MCRGPPCGGGLEEAAQEEAPSAEAPGPLATPLQPAQVGPWGWRAAGRRALTRPLYPFPALGPGAANLASPRSTYLWGCCEVYTALTYHMVDT